LAFTLELSAKARSDLDDIAEYSRSRFGLRQADVYIDTLETAFIMLLTHPFAGYDLSHIGENYRCYNVEHHRLFYIVTENKVVILRVLHKSMLPTHHLTQRDKFQ